ncbi:MAG TPA: hypothetical protein VLH18_00225 [Candidatus Limnocylindrales bacterium]|nr:hypothetical protein [Candidatus Limnocylindrales bacterium]
MSDLKICPFCREDIPIKAIKCKHCESMVGEIEPVIKKRTNDAAIPVQAAKKKSELPREGVYYQPVPGNINRKRHLLPLVMIIALLFIFGAGAGYWFLFRDDGGPAAPATTGDIVGSWQGITAGEEILFQFLTTDMVSVAVPPEGYWFRTQYRLIPADSKNYLELYHSNKAEWERIAEIEFKGPDLITMTDTWDGIVVDLERIPEPQFRAMISTLTFER